jgi:hypothetical protein
VSDQRLTSPRGPYPGSRFRCLVCRKFVHASEIGVCPDCGFVPPRLLPLPSDRPPGRRVATIARLRGRPLAWLIAALVAALAALAVGALL